MKLTDQQLLIVAGVGGVVLLAALLIVIKNADTVARKGVAGAGGVIVDAATGVIQGAGDVVSGALNSGAQAVSGDRYDTFGTALWKWINPDAYQREREMFGAGGSLLDRPGGATGGW